MAEAVRLDGKCVLVTGGSMGIGFAAAEASLRAGARVGICARTAGAIGNAVDKLQADGLSDVVGIPGDVTKLGDVERILDELDTHFGPLSAVIHAAGVYGPIGPITDIDPEAWLEAVRINLFGSVVVVRQAARRLAAHGGGRIALFSGGGAATPFPNYTAYACGKVAVVRLTETVAAELAPLNVEVNCIAPGFVLTRLHEETLAAGARAGDDFLASTKAQMEKGGVPASVGADCAVFLVSDAARGISGKFVAAPYDGFLDWPDHLDEVVGTELFTLRRVVPRDRGLDWQ